MLTVSIVLSGLHGIDGAALSVPSIISASGGTVIDQSSTRANTKMATAARMVPDLSAATRAASSTTEPREASTSVRSVSSSATAAV